MRGAELFYVVEFFLRNTLCIENESRVIAERHGFCSELNQFFYSVLRDVSVARHRTYFTGKVFADFFQHTLRKIDEPVARRFRTDERAAEVEPLTGEHSGKRIRNALVLSEHKRDFASAHSFVACRHIRIGADVAVQFRHERLAKAHHFRIRFSVRIEIASALSAAHRERR